MGVSPVESVGAFSRPLDPPAQLQSEVSLSVMKKALDAQAAQALTIMRTIQPAGIGATVDFKI